MLSADVNRAVRGIGDRAFPVGDAGDPVIRTAEVSIAALEQRSSKKKIFDNGALSLKVIGWNRRLDGPRRNDHLLGLACFPFFAPLLFSLYHFFQRPHMLWLGLAKPFAV